MSNKKLSQLPDNAAPNADGTSVAAVTASTTGGVTTYTNQIVTVRNLVKAGVQAGGVGLATVATTGSYTNLTNVPATFPPSSHNHDDRYYTEAETDTLLAGKQATGNYATLDGSGRVPAAQLPSYVDDVEEYANLASLPATGQQGKIYVALDTNKIYRWSGTTYLEISPSPGSTDSVAEGTVNLYYTNTRAAAAAPVQSVAGRTGAVVLAKTDVGLGNVPNTDATMRSNHTGSQAATTITGLSTVATSGSYTDLSNRPATFPPSAHTHTLAEVTDAGTAASRNAPATGDATSTQVVLGSDTRLTNSRSPIAHTHGTADIISGTFDIARIPTGTTATTVCIGNDSRLSDARTPTNHVHGNITNAGAIGTTASLPIITTTSGVLTTGSFGTTAGTFCQGNDSRLSDSRTPTSHTHPTSDITGLGTIATQNANSVAITGGTINGTAIGATAASTGAFTTVTTTGNVSVGTTAIVGARFFDISNTDATLNSAVIQRLITRNAANTANTTVDFVKYNSGPFYIVNNEGPMYFGTGGVGERIALLANGNFGIGNVSPGDRLSVSGNASTTGDFTCGGTLRASTGLQTSGGRALLRANGEQYAVGAAFSGTSGFVYFGARNESAAPDAVISNAGGGTLMTLQNGGNVGIGTVSPQNRLHVDSASNFSPLAVGGSDAVGGIQFRNTGATLGYIYYDTTPSMIFQVAASEKMRILTNGNVGIGTASPSSRLHVTGGTVTTDDGAISPRSIGPETIIEFTGNRTLALTDAGRLLVFTGTATTNITVPADASVNFPIGTRIRVLHANASTADLNFTPFGGTPTIRADSSGFGPFTRNGFNVFPGEATITKIAADLWVLTGNARQR